MVLYVCLVVVLARGCVHVFVSGSSPLCTQQHTCPPDPARPHLHTCRRIEFEGLEREASQAVNCSFDPRDQATMQRTFKNRTEMHHMGDSSAHDLAYGGGKQGYRCCRRQHLGATAGTTAARHITFMVSGEPVPRKHELGHVCTMASAVPCNQQIGWFLSNS